MPTYVVRPGDTLWGIATAHLGAARRWREIWALNDNRPEPAGTFENPNCIYPG
ncbi:MAG: LysM peptidoglycan-binding domain-containing protein [Acidimicrobiales bacterium]